MAALGLFCGSILVFLAFLAVQLLILFLSAFIGVYRRLIFLDFAFGLICVYLCVSVVQIVLVFDSRLSAANFFGF